MSCSTAQNCLCDNYESDTVAYRFRRFICFLCYCSLASLDSPSRSLLLFLSLSLSLSFFLALCLFLACDRNSILLALLSCTSATTETDLAEHVHHLRARPLRCCDKAALYNFSASLYYDAAFAIRLAYVNFGSCFSFSLAFRYTSRRVPASDS